jgi:hypothetical protein
MDSVVVENEMDPTSAPVSLCHKLVQKVQEQEAVLPVALDPCELTGFGIESAGEVALLIASRSANVVLLPGRRPVGPILGLR